LSKFIIGKYSSVIFGYINYAVECIDGVLNEFPVHIFISNQSLQDPISVIKIELDKRQLFQKQMWSGSQHNWEEIKDAILLPEGRHTLLISEVNTNINKSQEFVVESELWIVITFHGQQSGFKIEIFNRTIGFM
jgi:hypothetical protein